MLFNSFEFIFLFLPITVGIFFGITQSKLRQANSLGMAWLVLASLFFYGWWNPKNLWLIVFSIVFNYAVGYLLSNRFLGDTATAKLNRKLWLVGGIIVNLLLLGYFKYFHFFVDTLSQVANLDVGIEAKVLPLAISFFTFQQIGYLVDAYRGQTKEYGFLNYSLFVTFFPQLIAGPIVHHKDVLGQFSNKAFKFSSACLSVGLAVFFAGLFKKVVFADSIAYYANAVFDTVAQGKTVTLFEAWIGALAYTLQLYFDFSGYSDMAIGAAYVLGIRLPLNFNSPYKASSIVDFWRRWHITLSNFLRDYLYIPLGGNRKGELRRSTNLMLTMLLGGLWHGAGWTFVVWGALHGTYLVINHQWSVLCRRLGGRHQGSGKEGFSFGRWFSQLFGGGLTFMAVVVSWVVFRADSMASAGRMLSAMFGIQTVALPLSLKDELSFLDGKGFAFTGIIDQVPLFLGEALDGVKAIGLLLVIVWCLPNVQEWMGRYSPVLTKEMSKGLSADKEVAVSSAPVPSARLWHWRPNVFWSILTAVITAVSVLRLTRVSEFLYFQF